MKFTHEDRDRVAAAIYGVQLKIARDIAEKYNFDLDSIKSVFDIADSESDRSLAILLFALAEDLMLHSLAYYAKGKPKGGWEGVTSGNGVLATANDRIAILELLGWIGNVTADHLRLMKSIRNRFAHHSKVNDFEDNKVRGWVSSMMAFEEPIVSHMSRKCGHGDWKHSPRELFIMRSVLTIQSLVQDLAVLPAAIAQTVHPADVAGRNFDDALEPLQNLRRLSADIICRACFEKRSGDGPRAPVEKS